MLMKECISRHLSQGVAQPPAQSQHYLVAPGKPNFPLILLKIPPPQNIPTKLLPPKKLTVGTPNERFLQVRFISFSRKTPCFEVPGWFVFGILAFDIHYDFPWNVSDSEISIWRVGKVSPNIANPFQTFDQLRCDFSCELLTVLWRFYVKALQLQQLQTL